MAILEFQEDTHRCVLRPQRGEWAGRRLQLVIGACDNPLCPCTIADVACVPIDVPEEQALSSPPMRFGLDLTARKIDLRPGRLEQSAVSAELANEVVAELGEEEWRELSSWFMQLKQEVIEHADVRHLDAVFPARVMARDGTMVACCEIFPFAQSFGFLFQGDRWCVDDQYCVMPGCRCCDTALTFVRMPGDPGPDARMKEVDELTVRYDYDRRAVKETLHGARAGAPDVTEMLKELRTVHPTLEAQLRKRHQKLRVLFRRALAKGQADWASPEPEVGRNEPCPCGSGKKFKKCCGA